MGGGGSVFPGLKSVQFEKKPYNFRAKKIKSVQFVHFGHPVHTLCLKQGYI